MMADARMVYEIGGCDMAKMLKDDQTASIRFIVSNAANTGIKVLDVCPVDTNRIVDPQKCRRLLPINEEIKKN
jgi:hypothetical protein